MYVTRVEYADFRNIESASVEPSESVTLLYGGNAEGKTAALEGIYLFAYGRSFRAAKERELVRFGEKAARVKLFFTDRRRENILEMRIADNGRRALIRNGVAIKRLSEFVGCFRAVLFCPQHLSIVRQGPSERRSFIDSALTQLNSDYVRSLQRYSAVLAERNSLIRSYYDDPNAFNHTIDVWSDELAAVGEKVAAARYAYAERLNKSVRELFADMTSGKEQPELIYTQPKSASEYSTLLNSSHEREIAAKTTLFGPHRDDIAITLNGKEARLYASQGQQRSIALSMKLAEGEISRADTGEYPVFLFDDVMSELDSTRRSFLMNGLTAPRQVIMTSCDKSEGAASLIKVSGGKYGKC